MSIVNQISSINSLIQLEIDKKKSERIPDTFSILYRTGPGSSHLEYNQHFLDELERRQGQSVDKEIDIRTNPTTYDIYLERRLLLFGNSQPNDYRKLLRSQTNLTVIEDLRQRIDRLESELHDSRRELAAANNQEPYTGDNKQEYSLELCENIPNILKNSFTIVNYPEWGEVIDFDYTKLKADMLDEYMKTNSKETLDVSYNRLLEIMEKFPTKYTIRNKPIVEVKSEKPYEILEQEDIEIELQNRLINTEYYREISTRVCNLVERKPMFPGNLYIYENNRYIIPENNRPQFLEYETSLHAWKDEMRNFYITLPDIYKELPMLKMVLVSHAINLL